MVEGQAQPDAHAPVVPDKVEGVETERLHDLHLVVCGGALAIGRVVAGDGGRLVAVAIAPQVGTDDAVALRQARRDLVPFDMALRIAVQHQDGRPLAAMRDMDLARPGVDPRPLEPLEHAPPRVCCFADQALWGSVLSTKPRLTALPASFDPAACGLYSKPLGGFRTAGNG